jgi:hypothetical protein
MERGAHHVAQHVEHFQSLPIHLKQTIPGSNYRDLSLARFALDRDPFPHQRASERRSRIVLMYLIGTKRQDKEMLLADALKMANILVSDDMALAEGRPFEFVLPDLGDIVGKHHADSLVERDGFGRARRAHRIRFVMMDITHACSLLPVE